MTIFVEDLGDIPLGPGLPPADVALATRAVPRGTTFLSDVASAEQQTPLAPPPAAPDPDDPKYAGAPQAYV
ncbi:MAG: hypothetical protein ACRD15_11205, partial [Vicinamibacterales bacterium]